MHRRSWVAGALIVAGGLALPGAGRTQARVAQDAATGEPSPQSTVLAPGAVVEKRAGGFLFTEGATTDTAGNVYFVDQDNNRILKHGLDGQTTVFLEPSGRANGMTFDGKGHLIAAADERNELWSIDIATKAHTVLVKMVDGKYLNGPNDIYVHPSGRIYFTDPYYRRSWWDRGDRLARENPEAVYFYVPTDGSVTRVVDDMQQPNGVIGTPDGQTLYVADYRARQILRFDLHDDGTLGNKRLFAPSGADGMTLDSRGNVYLTTGQAVVVYDREGRLVESIPVPEIPSNVCFGGADMSTLFITARTSLYAVKTLVRGVGFQ